VHEVIAECLRRSDRALYLPDPGAGLNVLGAPALDVVRAAASRFLDGCAMRTGGMPGDLLEVLEGIVSLEYERSAAAGRIVVVGQSRALAVRSVLARAVSLRDSRAIRKLLEVSDEDVALLTDGSKVFGLGDIESHGSGDRPAFEIIVPSHATFELRHDGVALMRVAYGRPALPRPMLDRGRFDDVVTRVLAVKDTTILWTIVEAAASSGHGTIIVVSADAEGEAERLSGQATLLEPHELRADDVTRFSRIDGATLLDVEGRCHAVGVILDGEATAAGDPSRGSRFNSSLRYQASSRTAVVAVVVSDDGYVDLVPDLKPMVKRSDVQAVVEAFRDAATADSVEGELFARTHDSVKAISFYLDEVQCREVNDLYEHEQDRRLEGGGIAIRESPLRPNPAMNDSYFLEE
jgi:CTP:molybdopterin cytidylyltransferase MocA